MRAVFGRLQDLKVGRYSEQTGPAFRIIDLFRVVIACLACWDRLPPAQARVLELRSNLGMAVDIVRKLLYFPRGESLPTAFNWLFCDLT